MHDGTAMELVEGTKTSSTLANSCDVIDSLCYVGVEIFSQVGVLIHAQYVNRDSFRINHSSVGD